MADKSDKQLPLDWTEDFKVEKNGRISKYYLNVRTGQKFFSKEDLLRYIEMKRTQLHESHPTHGRGKRGSENSSSQLVTKQTKHENNCGQRHSENRSSKLVAKDNCKNSRGKRHLENNSSKIVAKENNYENSHGKSSSKNTNLKPVSSQSNHENGQGERHSADCITKPVTEEINRPEWLPDGWVMDLRTRKSGSAMGRQYKIYIEPLTGRTFFSMPEVLRYLESVKNKNFECERKTTCAETSKYDDAQKVSAKTERETTERDSEASNFEVAQEVSTKRKRETTERVVVEKSTVDDLPPGWIKEIKIRKSGNKTKKDQYYTDPVSGYVFASKRDVFRYLETGQISRCRSAFKPSKGGTDDYELVSEESLPSPCNESQKLEHTATQRQLFPVKESSDVCSPAVLKSEVLKKRRGKELSAEIGLSADISPEQTAKMAIDKDGETKYISSLSGSPLPKFRDTKRTRGKMLDSDNGSVSTPVIDTLEGQRLIQSHVECSNEKTPNELTKSVKKKRLNFPLRSSKRLAGLEPELLSNCMTDVTIPSGGEPSNKLKCSGTQDIPREQLKKFKSAETICDKSGQPLSLFFGDSLIDPCLESAFKALMGELPGNSNPNNEPSLNPVAKSMQTTEEEKGNARKSRVNSMHSKNKQELNLPRRSSNRLAGFEPEMVANCNSIERAPKNLATEPCKSKGILAADLTSSGLGDEVSRQLKAGPVLGLPNRESLAGFEPEMVANCKSIERAPKNLATEPCKSKGILAADLTSSGLGDEVSRQLKAGPVLGLPNRASEVLGFAKPVSSKVNIPLSGEPSDIIKSSENLAMTGGQSAEANGDKLESHVSLSSGDSCLHPYKAVVGETLLDFVPANEPASSAAADILPDKKLQETKVQKNSNKKTRIKSMNSKNKQELSLPRRSSKRLAGLEPELVSYSVAGEQACGNATIESCKSEAPTCGKTYPQGPVESASQQVEAGHETVLERHDALDAQIFSEEPSQKLKNEKHEAGHETVLEWHDCTDAGTLLLEGSPDKSSKTLVAQIFSEEPSQKLKNEMHDAGHETVLERHDCTDAVTLLFEGSPDEGSKTLDAQFLSGEPYQKLESEKPEEQPQNVENEKPELQKLENVRADDENPGSHILFPFGDSWSDPCLEFAFKTLTGAIPVDENLAIQDYLQHQINPCNSQKDDSPAVPSFGHINSLETDPSHPSDAPEKQLLTAPLQQQLPANPIPPPGNVSVPGCSGIASQQTCMDGNKELQEKGAA